VPVSMCFSRATPQEVEELGLDLSEHGETIGSPYNARPGYNAGQTWDAANSSIKTTRVVPVTSQTPVEPLGESGALTISSYD